MKKIVAAFGLIVFLSTGIIIGTKAVQSVRNSIENYIEEDKVANPETTLQEQNEVKSIKIKNSEVNNSEFESNEAERAEVKRTEVESNELESEEAESDEVKSIEVSAIVSALNITNPAIELEASNAILMDCESGKVLYHKNAMLPIYPASTTKLMTVLVALDLCDVTEEVTVGNEVNFIASDSSRAYLKEGQKLTIQMLLEGAILPSGNDAAYVIAAYCGRKLLDEKDTDEKAAINRFVEQMNQKAEELGLVRTQFKNPDGYDEEGQYTTAYDMGIIAIEALKHLTIRVIANKASARNIFLSGEDVTWKSSNKLINTGSGMYYEYAIGLKTGTSSLAGKCLISAAEKDGKKYISVVMNSTSSGRWEDSIALLDYGITH